MLGSALPDPAGRFAFAGMADAGRAAVPDGSAGLPAPRRPEASAPAAPGSQAVLGAPTSVDLPEQADPTIPVELPAARAAPSGPAPGRPARLAGPTGLAGPASPAGPNEAGRGESPHRPPTPAAFFAEPSGTVPPPSPPNPPSRAQPLSLASLPSTQGRAARPGKTAGPGGTARGPNRRALIPLGVLALVVAVAAAVMGLRAYRHPSGLDTTGQVAVESPVAAAAPPPSTGPLPAGYQLDKLAGSSVGANAGYTVAVPVTWTVVSKEKATHFYAPGVHTFLEIDLTPHTYADMVTEARTLANQSQAQGHFPGYQEIAIRPVKLRGMNAASWEFTWQEPGVGRVHVLDLMYIADTQSGRQSYALYMTAPERAWTRSLAAFDEEMRTFRPAP
jgi:hypothetical protein